MNEIERQRAAQAAAEKTLFRILAQRHGQAWARIRIQLDRLLADIADARAKGVTVDQGWLARNRHAAALERAGAVETRAYVDFTKRTIDRALLRQYLAGAIDADTLLRATLPEQLRWKASVPARETAQIAQATRPGTPFGMLLDTLPAEAATGIREKLVEGVALGKGPREIARDIRDGFAGNATRALRVARTETIRAYRQSAHQRFRENDDVVEGWTWYAELDFTTCAACVAMHGQTFPLDEDLDSHPGCRCTAIPVTKTWEQLGFPGVPETRFETESGEDWFDRQPAIVKQRVLGPGKFRLYEGGRLELRDLVSRPVHPVWGRELRERPLRELLTTV